MDLNHGTSTMHDNVSVQSALQVMQAHIEALNAGDEAKLAETLHFPHYRLNETGMTVWETPDSYFADFRARAGVGWHRSSFEDINVVHASDTKVHLDADVRRYDKEDRLIQSFRSLWVLTCADERWAAQLRSTFAPK